ncbi:hypothetical protein X975_20777, partial [Stegodyphus mimosarum]
MIIRQARTAPMVDYSAHYSHVYTSRGTVHHQAGLRSQRPLTPQHRRSRLEWRRSPSSWLPSDWHRIVFSDEAPLALEADGQSVRVWRGRGQRSQSAVVLQRHTAITFGLMV